MNMKRKLIVLLLNLLVPVLLVTAASAADFGTAVINGKSADRVHLRELPSLEANSLGLYFTGTAVQCESVLDAEWIMITIGRQTGYMKSEFLAPTREGIQSEQPSGSIASADGWAALREEPSSLAAVTSKLANQTAVTVLGETSKHWYYVQANGQCGYVYADDLRLGSAGTTTQPPDTMTYQMQSYSPNGDITILYPVFTGFGSDVLNAAIGAKVRAFTGNKADATLDYQCAVTLQNRKMVSMVFWGVSDVAGSIHPFTDLYTLNVDVSTGQEITFEDLYVTNTSFQSIFFATAYFPENPVTSYSAESFGEMLTLQTDEYQTINVFDISGVITCYLKPDGIVLSMPSIHATGSDHFEAEMRYADIQAFYIPAIKYWE